ncbi:C-type lectin domain family 10 member A-like [Electrophorus electricus]|uniref:C-type lectin domain family 10 member A-like n=1 Tax=Electrophorus electricus TaxID=8005 RepID=UPI0015D0356D|nr:C-type lectin domain family 10 member A-like [Electrophorus electricus]XP_035382697.1 C-type lectin domain family 10 member A-like [Electrophorus electricus]
MEECSVGYSKMNMDNGWRTSWKDHVRGKYSLLVSGTVVFFFLFVMVFVLFGHQESKFAELENFLKSHNSSTKSLNSDLDVKLQSTGTDLRNKMSELEKSMSSLSSYIDMYTSRTQNLLNSGPQMKTLSDIQTLINNLGSSLGSLFSKLENMLQDTTSQQETQNTKVKTLLESLNSSVSELATKLQNTIVHQDKKLTDVDSSLANLNSSLASFTSQLKNQLTEATGYQNGKVESYVLNLTTSLETLASRIKSNDEGMMTVLSDVKSELQSMNQSAESQNRMLTVVQASVLNLPSSMESLSSNLQNTVQGMIAALNDVKSKLESKGSTAAQSSCKPDWISYHSRCYLFSRDTLNWHQARDYCRSQKAMLVKLETEEEWEFVSEKTMMQNYWVGLTDEITGQWRWDDGTTFPVIEPHWSPDQPDDWKEHGFGEGGEDCGHFGWDLKLNDNHCSVKMKFICFA